MRQGSFSAGYVMRNEPIGRTGHEFVYEQVQKPGFLARLLGWGGKNKDNYRHHEIQNDRRLSWAEQSDEDYLMRYDMNRFIAQNDPKTLGGSGGYWGMDGYWHDSRG